MKIIINGEERNVGDLTTVEQIVGDLGLDGR